MKWMVRVLVVLAALVGAVLVVGMLLPEVHTASRSRDVMGTRGQVWAVLTDVESYPEWRSDVDAVEVLAWPEGVAWRETGSGGVLTFRATEEGPPRRWVSVVADDDLPFGGTWTYEVEAVGGAANVTRVTLIENGEIYNPIYRFVARFVLGYEATMERYLDDLEAHMGGAEPGGAQPAASGLWSVNGTELFVLRMGSGEPVIVVHGGPLLEHGYLAPSLEPLARSYELVFYDQRLSGRSAPQVDRASVRVSTFVEDIEALRQRLGAERVHLLAHSWGGHLALRYALAHGEHVASLVLVSPMPPSTALWTEEQQRLAGRVTPEDAAAMAALRSSPEVAEGSPDAIARLLRLSFRAQMHDPARADELQITVPEDYLERSRQLSFMMQDLESFDLVPSLASVGAPTLVVFGADEPAVEASGRVLADGIPGAELAVIPDAGHFAFLEQPEAFLRVVREFLGAHSP